MAHGATRGRRYLRAFVSGFFVAVPVTVTVLDRLVYVARVEGVSMQVSPPPAGIIRSHLTKTGNERVRMPFCSSPS